MATKDAEALIRKAVTDDVFRIGLTNDFDGTIEAHRLNLTEDEIRGLKAVDWKAQLPSKKDLAAATWVHIYKSGA